MHSRDLCEADPKLEPLKRVISHRGDAVVLLYAQFHEGISDAVGTSIQLSVGERAFSADKRQLVWTQGGVGGENIASWCLCLGGYLPGSGRRGVIRHVHLIPSLVFDQDALR